MTSTRSWTKTALCNAKIYRYRPNRRSLTTSVDNCPCTSIASAYIYFLRQSKPIQSMQRVTICQDSTHLPLEPYVSCKIFEQIIYNHQQQQLHLRHSQHPSPLVKLSGLNTSTSHATQAD